MEKEISVIIPCYNVEKYINRCVESVANQTIGLKMLEIILVDDCSTDDTWNRILDLERKYPENIIAIHCDVNGRQGTARNIGMQYATGEFIAFIDSDDWVDSDMFEIQYEAMKGSNHDIVMCGYWRDDGNSENLKYPKIEGSGNRNFIIDTDEKRGVFLMCMSMGTMCFAKLYKKSFLIDNKIDFLEGYAYEDHYFMLLLYLYVKDILIVDNRCYHYYVNNESTVMKSEAPHHYNVIDVDNIAWNECNKRGYLDKFRKQLECYFLLLGFVAPLKVISFRYDNPPYDFYLKLREAMLRKVPDYKDNKYIKEYATEFNYSIIETLPYQLNEKEFLIICEALKKRFG